jgi:hypothetical protein
MANLINLFKKTEAQIFVFFVIFIYFQFILSIDQFAEMMKYSILFLFYFFCAEIFYQISDNLNQNKEVKKEIEVEKKEIVKIPEFSWAKSQIEEESSFVKNNLSEKLISIIPLLTYFTSFFILFSPTIYFLFGFENKLTFILGILALPLFILVYKSFLANLTNTELHLKLLFIFIFINLIALIFKIKVIGFIISILTIIIYHLYYSYILQEKITIEEIEKIIINEIKFPTITLKNLQNQALTVLNFKNKISFNNLFFISFLTSDFLIAFINFNNFVAGTYILFSFLIKFLLFILIYLNYEKINMFMGENDLSKININLNILLFGIILFTVISSMISFLTVGVLFKDDYYKYHTSFPFIMLANLIILTSTYIYLISKKIDQKTTNKIIKFWVLCFLALIILVSFNSIETLSFYIVGTYALLSLIFYHLVIKTKDGYFANFL